MLQLTKKIDYGLIIMTDPLLSTAGASARDVSLRNNIALPTVQGILKEGAKNGLLTSTRGVQGGYKLARSTDKISLGDVIKALEGDFSVVECISSPLRCERSAECRSRPHMHNLQNRLEGFLNEITLAQIMVKTELKEVNYA